MGKSKSKSTPAADAAPGLSSFLLSAAPAPDAALDDIFATSKGATTAFAPKEVKERALKASTASSAPSSRHAQDNDEDAEMGDAPDADLSELESDASLGDLSDDDGEDDGVEEAYAARLAAERIKKMQGTAAGVTVKGTKRKAEEELSEESDDEVAEEQEDGSDEGDSEDDAEAAAASGAMDINALVMGSLKEGKEKKGKAEKKEKGKKGDKAAKRAEETPEERDARTVFLGNVPAECSTSKSMKKALVRHVLQNPSLSSTLPANCPPLKLDSIRFRSIAFASKVFGRKANAAAADGSGEGGEPGGRGRKRAREWRESEGSDERGVKGGFRAKEQAPVRESKSSAMTDAQKRRVAFIRGELNEGKKVCNAYLVLEAFPASALEAGLDVREVIRAVVAAANNSVFEGVTLHADEVRPRSAAALLAAAQLAAKPNPNLIDVPKNSDAHTVSATEARRTIFVGGLDFAETEENVRKATEAVLVRERGEAEGSYVESVRIVRDASSGLGKGFCYILFNDESCVDELLALPPGKNLKISKRKVRLERCKTSAAAARTKAATRTASGAAASSSSSGKPGSAKPKPVRLAAPRDPTLAKHKSTHVPAAKKEHQEKFAEALAALPSEERKKLKSLDADRIARRAQKKEQKRLSERYERKQANAAKKAGGGAAGEILGRAPRAMERKRKEKKRIRMTSKSTLKKPSMR
ncbi:hypothetical protein JCM8097_007875 [Rhodosporidiobolus ruineniae]